MPIPKLRYLSILLIFALFLGVWSGRTQLAELIISRSMHNMGLTNVTTDIRQINMHQSFIAGIEFSLVTDTGLFQLGAHNININYKPDQLSEGRVNSVTIDSLTLHYKSTYETPGESPVTNTTFEPLKIIAALRQALRQYIIANTVAINHISLHGESFGALQNKPLQLKASNNNSVIYTELSLLDQAVTGQYTTLRQLVITRLSEDTLEADLRLPQSPDAVPAGLELNIHDTHIAGSYFVDPQLFIEWLQPVANINGFGETGKVNGTLHFDFEAGDRIASTLTARSDKFIIDSYRADAVNIKLITSSPTSNLFQHTKLHNGSFIKAGDFRYESLLLGDTRINLTGDLITTSNSWQYDGGISSERLELNYDAQILQLENIAARVSANSEMLNIEGNFAPATLPGQFEFTLEHNIKQENGRISISPVTPIDVNAEKNRLSQLLTPWPYPFDLLAGSISLTSIATWSQGGDFRLTTGIKLEEAGGNYGELLFSDLSLDHELEILPKLHSLHTGKINLMHLDSGVTASNIVTHLKLKSANTGSKPQIIIQDLRGKIFGGTFSGDDFIFDLNNTSNSFKIKATNLDLAEIVETQHLEDIIVTGRVDGTIPVEINENGVFIEHGAFMNNVRAGTIRYNPATGTDQLKQNPLTGIALDALKDFRYSHLSADVNFTPGGLLTINLQLKGTSPELDTDRPVHLNINTEQNLLSLLKSLRFAEGVSENIDQKVRRQYEKSRSNK